MDSLDERRYLKGSSGEPGDQEESKELRVKKAIMEGKFNIICLFRFLVGNFWGIGGRRPYKALRNTDFHFAFDEKPLNYTIFR